VDNQKELNEKLFRFCGFKEVRPNWWKLNETDPIDLPYHAMPCFLVSLQDQIKYIFPALTNSAEYFGIFHQGIYYVGIIRHHGFDIKAANDKPEMAFALCCEKLIDSLEKK
jgi:hypothetical protein